MKYDVTDNGCLVFYTEKGEFLHDVLCLIQKGSKLFFPTGSVAFFGEEYKNVVSDFDFLIKMDDWIKLTKQIDFKKHKTEMKVFKEIVRNHYENFLLNPAYNDHGEFETWSILVNQENNKTHNIIICQTDDIFRMWKFATVCVKKICEVEKMKYALMKDKNERVEFFKRFKEVYRLYFIDEEIPF